MGLAASQARFLAITARKANCEFQSMQVAQEKLSVTRELEDATIEYQSALNATKLVWDPDGTGDNAYNLNYGIMMNPTAVNNYTPYMLSTRDGRIVLNSKMASAARQAGIPEGGCEPTQELYEKFINQMVKTGGMSESVATTVRTIGLLKNVGLGAPLMDRTQASSMTLNDMLAYINLIVSRENASDATEAEKQLAKALQFKFGDNLSNFKTSIENKGDAESNYFLINGTKKTKSDAKFTLSDLLTDDITYARTGEKNKRGLWRGLLSAICSIGSGFMANLFADKGIFSLFDKNGSLKLSDLDESEYAMVTFINDLSYSYLELLDIDLNDDFQAQAFAYALQETVALLTNSKDLGSRNHSVDAFKDAVSGANNYNGWTLKNASKNKNYGTTAISLSNLAESFLTFYAQAENDFTSVYQIVGSSQLSSYVTDDPTYIYNIKNPNATTAEEIYNSEFYSAMFNNICNNGWYEDEQIDDEKYLGNTLKNARYFVTSMGNDLYYYPGRYTNNDKIVEITDDNAIKEAELAYTQKKSKLNYKEEKLELKMKKLDLEISSLTTEYDTVKNLINNNVEKTFTMFN